MTWRMFLLAALSGAAAVPGAAQAQMHCRESASDDDFKIQVSVCVTDSRRDLIVHVRNLDKRRKEVVVDCSVDLTSIGGARHRANRVPLYVSEHRPNNRHVLAPQIPDHVATGFRALNTQRIQCRYYPKLLEQQI